MRQENIELLRQISIPSAHTEQELTALINLLQLVRPSIKSIAIGHGRDSMAINAANALSEMWKAKGGFVATQISWAEGSASWFKTSTQFTYCNPDAWVVTGALLGWAQMSRRLQYNTNWNPKRTFGFASVADARLLLYSSADTFEGMRGVLSNGRIWCISNGRLLI
ncbi:hypothetical protein [Clostridium sp. OS1-26]|uniref:hypothetical protein n=1 Tax=Clostridium sp. OS1-26 TaxID=3070681 RepID=UPI0027E04B0C|nr:hypothetical protein [Clostridium sp. OS1-26]WML34534.1 hypothetical protein RCG18_25185 [Clostridium sp. OS1-26]